MGSAPTSSISPSQGFHFTITNTIPVDLLGAPFTDLSRCSHYILHDFPSTVFLDPYELAQRREDSRTLATLSEDDTVSYMPEFRIWSDTIELELPEVSVDPERGRAFLLLGPLAQRDRNETSGVKTEITVDIPFHARYPLPMPVSATSTGPDTEQGPHATVRVPSPGLLRACKREAEETTQNRSEDETLSIPHPFVSPFDPAIYSTRLTYPFKLVGSSATAVSSPSPPVSGSPSISAEKSSASFLTVLVPRGDQTHLTLVQPITLLVMLACACYVAYTALLVAASPSPSLLKKKKRD